MTRAKPNPLMPVGFVGHGSPMIALEKEGGPAAWKKWAGSIEKPKAILVFSAHWLDSPPRVGPTQPVGLIYDFYGFPAPLYQVHYPAPIAPALAGEVTDLLEKAKLHPVRSSHRGLDHGTWAPLLHMYPKADIPVLQVSLGTNVPMKEHLALGKALAPLRKEGVLILGSGNIVHNLRRAAFEDRWGKPESWALEFDQWCAEALERYDLDALADYQDKAPGAGLSVPTDDHYTPLLAAFAAALEETGQTQIRYPHQGFEYQTLSMRSVEFR